MSRRAGRFAFSPGLPLLVAAAILLIYGAGCLWGKAAKSPAPPPSGEQEESYSRIEEEAPAAGSSTAEPPGTPPLPASPGPGEEPDPAGKEIAVAPAEGGPSLPTPPGDPGTIPPPTGMLSEGSPGEAPSGEPGGEPAPVGAGLPAARPLAPDPHGATPAAGKSFAQVPPEVPVWATGKEVLVYRVEFLGMTMGYARFTFKGKVSLRGREAYHLNVRAWTSDFLSVIYPINDTIDYYLDVKTLAPLRQEFARPVKGKDDVMTYDQENGKIVYRYKATGEIRKQVDVPPVTYDPVSVAYYFRARDLGAEDRPRHMYGGRKLYQISTRLLGKEKIGFSGRPVDAVVVQPVIKRDGRPDDKGDLRMWMTNDARRVPVRIFAKFKKIRTWTLTAELIPPPEGG